ncbi:energy transducer TonB [Marinifilum caeruleilacunae]|uniref:Energy transducer TonB n=1 Tax=Marinifilum caeruleilacunae TaxID=2499076 RepID=A0ABX1WZ41_9BACT|nr:energy transducer TonB [Marinifilum caeruleilacunae]NOU61425.1 energy transducer TonB [Marinifilum caeruleilacunae]
MEVKKNPRHDLEKKRGMFLQIGFLISFLFVLAAFEYKTPVAETEELAMDIMEEIDEIVPVTVQDKPKPKEQPKVKLMELTEIMLTEDDDEIDDLEIIDASLSEDDEYDIRDVSEDVEEVDEDTPFVKVEQMPIFNPKKNKTYEQGQRDLFITMQKMTRYPIVAQENGVQGKVFVRFVVTKTGEISNIKVVRSVDPALDKEAIRVVSNLPKFKPGMQRNKPVSVWFSGYISFVLQ